MKRMKESNKRYRCADEEAYIEKIRSKTVRRKTPKEKEAKKKKKV